jgi:hypothetical protein
MKGPQSLSACKEAFNQDEHRDNESGLRESQKEPLWRLAQGKTEAKTQQSEKEREKVTPVSEYHGK